MTVVFQDIFGQELHVGDLVVATPTGNPNPKMVRGVIKKIDNEKGIIYIYNEESHRSMKKDQAQSLLQILKINLQNGRVF